MRTVSSTAASGVSFRTAVRIPSAAMYGLGSSGCRRLHLQPFERDADGVFDRSVGRLFQNGGYGFFCRALGESEHDECRRRFLVNSTVGRRTRFDVARSERSHFAAQLDDDLLGCLEAQSLDVFQQDGIFRCDDGLQLARREGREDHARRVAAHARNAEEQPEQLSFGFRGEAVEQLGVFAHDVVYVEPCAFGVFDPGIGRQRDVEVVSDASGVDDGIGRSEFGHGAAYIFIHRCRKLIGRGQK